MDPDLIFVIGLFLGLLAIPSFLNAYSEGRPPRFALGSVVIAAGLIAYAVHLRPNGYSLNDVPQVVFRVIGSLVNGSS